MTVSGDALAIRDTIDAIGSAPCTAPVGLFGLHTNTRPAPDAAAIIFSRSSVPSSATGTSLSGNLASRAVRAGDSNVGAAETTPREADAKAMTEHSSSSPEPAPSATFSIFRPFFFATSVRKSAIDGRAFIG